MFKIIPTYMPRLLVRTKSVIWAKQSSRRCVHAWIFIRFFNFYSIFHVRLILIIHHGIRSLLYYVMDLPKLHRPTIPRVVFTHDSCKLLGFCLIFQKELMVQENLNELEKMIWSRRSKSRWNISFSDDYEFLFQEEYE